MFINVKGVFERIFFDQQLAKLFEIQFSYTFTRVTGATPARCWFRFGEHFNIVLYNQIPIAADDSETGTHASNQKPWLFRLYRGLYYPVL